MCASGLVFRDVRGTFAVGIGNISSSPALDVLVLVCGDVELSARTSFSGGSLSMVTVCEAKGDEIDGLEEVGMRASSALGTTDSCIAVARDADVEERRLSGREG